MTCIIGLEHNGTVYLGADRAVTVVDTIAIMDEPKIYDISNGLFNFIISDAGNTKMGNIIQYRFPAALTQKTTAPIKDMLAYMRTTFAETLAETFNEHLHQIRTGRLVGNAELESLEFNEMLIGVKGKLFKMVADMSVLAIKDKIDAIGAGADIAIGSLAQSLKRNKKRDNESIKQYIHDALEISAKYKEGVEPPFDIWTLKKNGAILTATLK